MQITIKIVLNSGKEIEVSEQEFEELKAKAGRITKEPYFIPYVPDPWPNYPYQPYPGYPWYTFTCADSKTDGN